MNGDPCTLAAEKLLAATAVLLDFNGTLSLDEDLLEDCYARALAALDLAPPAPGEYATLLGRSEEDIAAALLVSRAEAVTTDALLDEVAAAYVEACRERPHVPAAHLEVVRALHARGIPLAIVTGTLRRMIEPVLADLQLSHEIPVVVTIEDVRQGKPDPEGFRRGLELLGVDAGQVEPGQVVVLEDSPSGVAAGHALGAFVIGCGGTASGADVEILDLASLASAKI
ncbi:HAD family phosphatase [Brachybacterium muris]|uniref:HAD family hydrolase n=1 Tax=Brachybacterium muris TaxID=219301 RepID=UPI0021A5FD71|nr:HAD family phosphatase [Brachybacterium muris]MCT1430920.1 HAD family phosphatase [Brachybacterium muris]